MPGDSQDTVAREQRLDEIILAYLQALDASQRPDWRELAVRHPGFTAELQEYFTEHDQLERWARPLRCVAQSAVLDAAVLTGLDSEATIHHPWAPRPVQIVDEYELLEPIARGGMGVVYKARDRRLNRLVAVKMIQGGPRSSPTEVLRFQNEAEMVARLDHPHIVPIYKVGDRAGRPYLSMKLLEGGSLADHLSRFVAAPREAARLLVPVARAIHHAHQRGILHRDLKPANVLLDRDGQPHVTDFGLAKRLGAGALELTQSGAILGTPAYMAPEQASGHKGAVTVAPDVYGLGALLYALLTGRPPFQGEDVPETLAQVANREPEPPRKINPAVARDLELICLKCLEKEPHRRYPSAEALANELERYLDGRSLALTRPTGRAERLWRWCRRNPALAGACGSAARALVAVAVVSTMLAVHQTQAKNALAHEQEKTAAALDQSRRLSATLALDQGLALCERGEVGHGMPWLTRSLEIAPDDAADLRRVIRANLSAWRPRLCPLQAILPHKDAVEVVAFSPNGKTVVTAGMDRTARLWDAETGQPVGEPMRHDDYIDHLAVSPDGTKVLTGSGDQTARLWDAATGKPIGKPMRHEGGVFAIAFRGDGQAVVTGSWDGTARLWDATTGQPWGATLRHQGPALGVAFSPDGRPRQWRHARNQRRPGRNCRRSSP